MSHYVYILKSLSKVIHYYGETSDLDERIKRHNADRNKFTKQKGPWELVVSLEVENKSIAYKLEQKLKKMKNPKKAIQYLEKLKENNFLIP